MEQKVCSKCGTYMHLYTDGWKCPMCDFTTHPINEYVSSMPVLEIGPKVIWTEEELRELIREEIRRDKRDKFIWQRRENE